MECISDTHVLINSFCACYCIQTHLDYNKSWFTFSQILSVFLNKSMEHEHIDMISLMVELCK